MFYLTIICATLLNITAEVSWNGHAGIQDDRKGRGILIGFQNSSTENGGIDYYSNTLLKSLEVRSGGVVEMTPNDLDIKSISPDGFIVIKERDWLTYRSITLTAAADGKIEKKYTIQGRDYEFDSDAQAWLSLILQDVARETGLGAQGRIKKILAEQGAQAAIREIRWVNSNYAKKIYFEAILNHPDLSSQELEKAVETVANEISSSSKLGDILISSAGKFQEDSVLTESLIRATKEISSSSKQSEVLIQLTELRVINDESAEAMAKVIKHISSSSAQSSVLQSLAQKSSANDKVVEAYVDVVKWISSSSEQGAALKALLRKKDMSSSAFIKILKSIEHISSSSVQGDVLEEVAAVCPSDDQVLFAFLNAVSNISSSSQQGYAVMSMLSKQNVSTTILTRTLNFSNEEISSRSVRDKIADKVTERLSKKAAH
ncbi:hypothetical protein F9K33_04485 [bacterium]|nr:MAG: hypothetical protein F9K33_04485 [bacterium]